MGWLIALVRLGLYASPEGGGVDPRFLLYWGHWLFLEVRPVPLSSLAITCRPRNPSSSCYLSYFKFLWILGAFCIDDYLIWARPSCTPLSAVWRYFWICKYSFGTRCVFLPFLNDWLMFVTTLINLFSYIFQVLHMRKLTVKWKIYSMSDSSTTL